MTKNQLVICLLVLSLFGCSTLSHESATLEDSYMIGRASMELELQDGTRLQLEAWFPALPGKGQPDYAITPALKSEMVQLLGIPAFALSTRERTRGFRDLEPAAGRFPVAVFSHGFASFSRQNTRQLEALAMAGYLALAVSHPGDSLTTEYQDGTLVTIDHDQPALEYLRERDKKALSAQGLQLNGYLQRLAGAQTDAEYLTALAEVKNNTLYGASIPSGERRTAHLVELVENLDKVNHPLMQHADLNSIALYGHSLGGIASVAAGTQLVAGGFPVKAMINLDAAQLLLPENESMDLAAPTCFVMGGATRMGTTRLAGTGLNTQWARRQTGVCEINVATAAHNNFTDLGWVTPLKWFGQLGPVKNKAFANWLNGFLISYFDHHLKAKPYDYPLWETATLTGQINAR